MANEITACCNLTVDHDYQHWSRNINLSVDQTGTGRGGHDQDIGHAADETIDFGDVATEGFLFLRNLDDTNYVTIGPDSGGSMVAMIKLLAGEWAWLRVVPSTTIRAQADTATVRLEVACFEN